MLKNVYSKLQFSKIIIKNSHSRQHQTFYNLQNFGFKKKLLRPENYKYTIENFNTTSSKYSIDSNNFDKINFSSQSNEETFIPPYLQTDTPKHSFKKPIEGEEVKEYRPGISMKSLKPGKRLVMPKKPFQKKPTKEERLEIRKQLRLEESKNFLKLANEERKLIDNNESALERTDAKYQYIVQQKYKEELERMRQAKREIKATFNSDSLAQFAKEERLSKRLSRLGVTSRRHAEKLISSGMIKVDGKTVKQNVAVNDLSNIQVFSTSGYQTPIKESTRIWLFYKPVGVSCSTNDSIGRISVQKYLEANKFCYKHFSIAGKLDAGSEGLLILTNNSDMAAAIEHNDTIERAYKIRVFGRMFTEEKLNQIRKGVKINMKPVKLWAEVISKQNTNTWLHVKTYNNSIIDIRNVFRRLSLRINRIMRTNYGPFSLGVLRNPGEVTETNIPKILHKYMYYRMKEKTQNAIRKLDDAKLEKVQMDLLQEQRLKRISESQTSINQKSNRTLSMNKDHRKILN